MAATAIGMSVVEMEEVRDRVRTRMANWGQQLELKTSDTPQFLGFVEHVQKLIASKISMIEEFREGVPETERHVFDYLLYADLQSLLAAYLIAIMDRAFEHKGLQGPGPLPR